MRLAGRLLNFLVFGFIVLLFVNAISFMLLLSTRHETLHYPTEPYAYSNWFAAGLLKSLVKE